MSAPVLIIMSALIHSIVRHFMFDRKTQMARKLYTFYKQWNRLHFFYLNFFSSFSQMTKWKKMFKNNLLRLVLKSTEGYLNEIKQICSEKRIGQKLFCIHFLMNHKRPLLICIMHSFCRLFYWPYPFAILNWIYFSRNYL